MMTESDLPWMQMLFAKKYPDRFDPLASEGWFKNVVLKNPVLFYPARTQNAFAISMLSLVPWLPNDFECNVAAICADDGAVWEAGRLIRCSVAWARSRNCATWRFCSDTGIDLGALCKRVGAKAIWPRYELRF